MAKANGTTSNSPTFTHVLPTVAATTLAKTANTGKINVVCGIASLTFGAQVAAQYPSDAASGGSAYLWPGRA